MLRKKNGWSQEELAEKMNVSRQSVSKWEGAQSVPDLDKILLMGKLFGVTTDYLLKDEIVNEEYAKGESDSNVKRIDLSFANGFIAQRNKASFLIAAAVALCIISPIPLIILSVAVDMFAVSEKLGLLSGLIFLFIAIAVAVGIFIYSGYKNAPYEFLEKEPFEPAYGVEGMIKEKQNSFSRTYSLTNIIGVVMCVLSPVILIIGAFTENDFYVVISLCVMLLLIAFAVALFVFSGIRNSAFKKLLQQDDYSAEKKKTVKTKEAVGSVYWIAVTALYLGFSFLKNSWGISWIIWPIAGVLFALICRIIDNNNK